MKKTKQKQARGMGNAPGYRLITAAPRVTEVKYVNLDLTTQFASVGTTTVTYNVSQIAQGATLNQRQGNLAVVRELMLDGVLRGGQSNLATDDSVNAVRMIVWVGAIGATPGYGFGTWPNPNTITGCERILYDSMFTLTSPGRDSTGYMPASRRVRFRLPVNVVCPFTSAAANSGSMHAVYLSMVTDSSLAPNPGFTQGYLATKFTDE